MPQLTIYNTVSKHVFLDETGPKLVSFHSSRSRIIPPLRIPMTSDIWKIRSLIAFLLVLDDDLSVDCLDDLCVVDHCLSSHTG